MKYSEPLQALELDGGLMAKVTGIGGVFFKSTNDHKKLAGYVELSAEQITK